MDLKYADVADQIEDHWHIFPPNTDDAARDDVSARFDVLRLSGARFVIFEAATGELVRGLGPYKTQRAAAKHALRLANEAWARRLTVAERE